MQSSTSCSLALLSLSFTLLPSNDVGIRSQHGRIGLVLPRHQPHVVLDIKGGVVVSSLGLEVEQQIGLDGAGDVGLEPGVVVGVELGGDADVFWVGDLFWGILSAIRLHTLSSGTV